MRIIGMVCFFMAASIVGTAQAQEIKLSKYAKVFKGNEGLTLTFVTVTPLEEKKALIEVTGIETDIDGVILLTEKEIQGLAEAYTYARDGQSNTILRMEQSWGWKQMVVYLPGQRDGATVGYDEKASKKVNVGAFLKRYLAQKKKGVQDKLAKFDRKKNEKYNNDHLAQADKDANKACGSAIRSQIIWSSVTDAQLKKLSIYSFCGNVAESLARLCGRSKDFKKSAQKIKAVECRFTKKIKLSIKGSKALFDIDPEAGNQSDFVESILKNQL